MSEHEMVKHAIKGYKAWQMPGKKTSHKVWDILIEMFIIIFAVTLSLALERWREHAAEKKVESDFLTGYRKDLINDINELKSDSASYFALYQGFSYFVSHPKPEKDSIKKYMGWFYNTTDFHPNLSRYEALKSSGKLEVITNKELLDDIVSLYQEKVLALQYNSSSFTSFKTTHLVPYLDEHLDSTSSNIASVLGSNIGRNYLAKRYHAKLIMEAYHEVIVLSEKIIREIDEELKKH